MINPTQKNKKNKLREIASKKAYPVGYFGIIFGDSIFGRKKKCMFFSMALWLTKCLCIETCHVHCFSESAIGGFFQMFLWFLPRKLREIDPSLTPGFFVCHFFVVCTRKGSTSVVTLSWAFAPFFGWFSKSMILIMIPNPTKHKSFRSLLVT